MEEDSDSRHVGGWKQHQRKIPCQTLMHLRRIRTMEAIDLIFNNENGLASGKLSFPSTYHLWLRCCKEITNFAKCSLPLLVPFFVSSQAAFALSSLHHQR